MKGIFIPEITAEMFRNGCLESIEALMAEGQIYDIEYSKDYKRMKVEVDGKMYCVETLIFDNERLREEVIASAELHRLVLDMIRAEIEALNEKVSVDYKMCLDKSAVLQIIDKYMAERSEE